MLQTTLTIPIPATLGIISVGGSVSVTAAGSLFLGPALSIGAPSVIPVFGSTLGYTSAYSKDFISGLGIGATLNVFIGGGVQWSPFSVNSTWAGEAGIGSPQAGMNLGYNFCIVNCSRP